MEEIMRLLIEEAAQIEEELLVAARENVKYWNQHPFRYKN